MSCNLLYAGAHTTHFSSLQTHLPSFADAEVRYLVETITNVCPNLVNMRLDWGWEDMDGQHCMERPFLRELAAHDVRLQTLTLGLCDCPHSIALHSGLQELRVKCAVPWPLGPLASLHH